MGGKVREMSMEGRSRTSLRRKYVLWSGIALGMVLVLIGSMYFYQHRAVTQPLVGGAIADPPGSAPDIALPDQFGRTQSISGLRGKPVALTFVYTNCTDVCSLISANLHEAYKQLGSRASQVGIVAVTVDPENDTQEQVRGFSDKFGLTNEWFFLTGTRPQLEKAWASYGIDAQKVKAQMQTPVAPGTQAAAGSPEVIEHAAPVFLIDKKGLVRAMLPTDVSAADIAHDLGVLLAER